MEEISVENKIFSRTNKIGDLENKDKRKKKHKINLPRKSARTVFEELKNLPKLNEYEKKHLKRLAFQNPGCSKSKYNS